MRILIAEDTLSTRRILEAMLSKEGFDVVVTKDGKEALKVMKSENSPSLVILDWMMPEMDGVQVCRLIREDENGGRFYIILLTGKTEKSDIVEGLNSGVDDYIVKPFAKEELFARVKAGERILNLQEALYSKIGELENSLSHVKTLQGIIPICSNCHKIRTDDESWQKIDQYIEAHSDAEFSHSLCDECLNKLYPEDDEDDVEEGDIVG